MGRVSERRVEGDALVAVDEDGEEMFQLSIELCPRNERRMVELFEQIAGIRAMAYNRGIQAGRAGLARDLRKLIVVDEAESG